MKVWTVGHSTHPLDAFVALLNWIPRWFLPYSSALIYSTMGFLMLWRLAILLRDQRA